MSELRKALLSAISVGALAMGLMACEKKEIASEGKGPAERAGQQIDQATARASQELKKITEKAGQSLQRAGQKLEDQAQEAQKTDK